MGLSVEATHGHTYTLRVNDADVTVIVDTRHGALMQAFLNFLVEFNPAAYIPTQEDCERMVSDPSLIPVGAIEIPDEDVLPPPAKADSDDGAPEPMSQAEAINRGGQGNG